MTVVAKEALSPVAFIVFGTAFYFCSFTCINKDYYLYTTDVAVLWPACLQYF